MVQTWRAECTGSNDEVVQQDGDAQEVPGDLKVVGRKELSRK